MQPRFESDARPIAALECSRQGRFEVTFADGLSTGTSARFAATVEGRRAIAVTTPTVDRLYGPALRRMLAAHCGEHRYVVMRIGERRKQLLAVQKLCGVAAQFGLDRRGMLIAIGGGVCSDVVTVSASMIRRGISHIRIPTTLIGQVDAGIGVKGAVNLDGLKSFLGTFHPPAAVLVDPRFLHTLPSRYIRQGLAEILKMALIRDGELFNTVDSHGEELIRTRFQQPRVARDILEKSIWLMLDELKRNPFEDRGFERLVDFGHTFSPTLEARSGFRLSHGDAVAVDMALSCSIGVELGLLPAQSARRFIALLDRIGLPIHSRLLNAELCREAMKSVVAHRGGRLNLVVPHSFGTATFIDEPCLQSGVLEAALTRLTTLRPSPTRGRVPRAERSLHAPQSL